MPDTIKAVESALDSVAERMSIVVRNRALEVGWPEHVATRLSVIRTANGLGVHVDDEVAEQAMDLEFGSDKSAPLSALSTLSSARTQKFQQRVAHESMDEILNQIRRMLA